MLFRSDTAANPVHIYNTTGVYNVTLITGNGVCPNDTITQQITVVVIGIEENGALSLLPVYPNPAHDIISIRMENHESSVRILIQDAVGRMLLQTSSDQLQRSGKDFVIPVTSFPSGTYTISIISDKNILSNRFTIIR